MIDFLIGPFKRINLGKYRVGAKHIIKHHVDIVKPAHVSKIFNRIWASSDEAKAPDKCFFPKTRN